jgi:hypothetical protein
MKDFSMDGPPNLQVHVEDPYWLDLIRWELEMRASGLNVQKTIIQKTFPSWATALASHSLSWWIHIALQGTR